MKFNLFYTISKLDNILFKIILEYTWEGVPLVWEYSIRL